MVSGTMNFSVLAFACGLFDDIEGKNMAFDFGLCFFWQIVATAETKNYEKLSYNL